MEANVMKLTQSYVKMDGPSLKLEQNTIPESLQYHAQTKPDGEAMIFVAPGGYRKSVTWSQLYHNSCQIARSLINLGVERHEVVAINTRPCPEWLYSTFGAMIAGAIPAAVSFTFTDGSDLIALMDKVKTCSLLIVDPGLEGVNWEILRNLLDEYHADGTAKSKQMPYLRYLLGIAFENKEHASNVKQILELLKEDNTDILLPEIQPDDISGLFQTSGSTGVPKLVAYVQHAVMKLLKSDVHVMLNKEYVLFNDRPFTWAGGYPFSLIMGQTRVTFSGFAEIPDPVAFMIEVIERERCSMIFALPPLMNELIKRKEHLPDYWPVEGIVTAGQPLTRRLAACVGKVCKTLLCVYGSTEVFAAAQATITDPKDFAEYGCGKPVPYPGLEIKIVDEKCEIVPVNKRGEIYVRHDSLFKEIFNDPEKTKAVKTEDGWCKTDDIGRFNEDGELFVEGRKSNMIISGGFNVVPEIIEQVMRSCPYVDSAIIVPVPDDVYYQVLCACVQKKNDCNVTEEYLRKFCEDYHADKPGIFTVLPKFYMLFEKFPETHSGKTNRKELKSLAIQRFNPTTC